MITFCTNPETLVHRLDWDDRLDSDNAKEQLADYYDLAIDLCIDNGFAYEQYSSFQAWNGGRGHGKLTMCDTPEEQAFIDKIEPILYRKLQTIQLKDRLQYWELANDDFDQNQFGITQAEIASIIEATKTELTRLEEEIRNEL